MTKSVRRTLSVHQEHELLGKLEGAGLTAKEAQFVIDSRKNGVAQRIVDLIKRTIPEDSAPRSDPLVHSSYNFTERIRRILHLARMEAARLNHEYVGTEHILLGIIREGEGRSTVILQNLGVNLEAIKLKVEERVKKGKSPVAQGDFDLPYTSRSKKVLELTMQESRTFGHKYTGSEHILLGLIREENGIAAQVLTEAGVNIEKARTEAKKVLGE